ncbi:hypothetical protein CS542_06425 [Pedobacter sp. IW39]|nr:hypothetical protein CS542_06425 [Pedobacter sp. IW39]
MQNFGMASTVNAFNFLRQTTPGVYPVYNGLYGFPQLKSLLRQQYISTLYSTGGKDQNPGLISLLYSQTLTFTRTEFRNRFNYQTRFEEKILATLSKMEFCD